MDGHGNFGSVDGDGAAAMRYTEARLTKISMEMLADINKDTVTFVPNFDETEKEPSVLPSRFPNLLVNGTTGIAVGMATNIPPHNLREVVAGVTKIIDNRIEEDRDTEISELIPIIQAPDFPTGGIIMGTAGAKQAYLTGKGKVITRAVTDIEAMSNGKHRIVVTELPYLVNKANLIQKIAELVKTKRIEGITDLRDESDREGMRVVIELRHDANPNIVLNHLFKHTQMQDTFGITMLALVNNEPKVMNLLEMLMHYLRHQEDVVTRRTQYDLNKAEERDHILQGLLIALDNIDEVVHIIRHSPNVQAAKATLKGKKGEWDREARKRYKKAVERRKRLILAAVLLCNFGVLAFLKYYNFCVESLSLLRRECKDAALTGLHYEDRLAMPAADLPALSARDRTVAPVEVVDLQLDILNLWMCGQQPVQQLGTVVIGEADVPNQPLCLLLLNEVPAVEAVESLERLGIHIVEPVIVKVPRTGTAQLFREEPFPVLFLLEHVGGELGGEGEAVPRMAGDQSLFHRLLTLAAAVHPGGVKIGEATLDKQVGHRLKLFDIDARLVVGVGERQTHQSKSKLFHHNVISPIYPVYHPYCIRNTPELQANEVLPFPRTLWYYVKR